MLNESVSLNLAVTGGGYERLQKPAVKAVEYSKPFGSLQYCK